MGSKKGGFPVSVESRSRGKTVTVIHNVNGDVEALLAELKKSLGGGGVVRDGNVEVQVLCLLALLVQKYKYWLS